MLCTCLLFPQRIAFADATHYIGSSPKFKFLFSPTAGFAAVSVPGANIFMSKLMYIGLNLAGLAVVIWKIRSMGLLPLTSADWVSLLPDKFSTQISSAPELQG